MKSQDLNNYNINKQLSDDNGVLPISDDPLHPLWFSVSEAAKIGGVKTKTIRRALQDKLIKYKIIGNRYFIEFSSMKSYLHTKTKLKNKFNQYGIGQYIDKWKL